MASGNRDNLKNIWICGPEHSYYGYGNMNVSLQRHLPDGVRQNPAAEAAVFCLQPNMVKGWYRGQRRSIFTMWETSELPAMFYEHLSQFDQVIVPCEHNKELFNRYHDNVKICPLGVDTNFWKPCEVPENKVFRFVAGGSSWQRKGLDLVVAAFEQLGLPNTELVLKITPEIRGEAPIIKSSQITIVENWLTLQQEYDLYASADCFVAASRGEGFGLMPLQTIAMGVPTIISDMTGHKEFGHLASSLIPAEEKPAIHAKTWKVGNWYESSVEDIKNAMLEQFEEKEQRRATALEVAPKVSAFTWNKASQKLVRTCKASGELTELDWVQADQALVQITVNRKVEADIGRHKIRLAKNETAMVPIVVRDTLRDAGYLGV